MSSPTLELIIRHMEDIFTTAQEVGRTPTHDDRISTLLRFRVNWATSVFKLDPPPTAGGAEFIATKRELTSNGRIQPSRRRLRGDDSSPVGALCALV